MRLRVVLIGSLSLLVGLVVLINLGSTSAPPSQASLPDARSLVPQVGPRAVPGLLSPVVQQTKAWWSDYVVVNSIHDSTLTVTTTRGDGHDHTPYAVTIGPETIVSPAAGGGEVFGDFSAVVVGDRFYFVGTKLTHDRSSVLATRIFVFGS